MNVFPSVNYQMEDSGSDDSVNDEHVKVHDDVYHDLHHDDEDGAQQSERMDSGKLSGSSGNDASDLYDYKVDSYSIKLCVCCVCLSVRVCVSVWVKGKG